MPAVTRFGSVRESTDIVFVNSKFWRARLGTSAISKDVESLELLEREVRGSVRAMSVGLNFKSVMRSHFSHDIVKAKWKDAQMNCNRAW